MSTDTHHKDLTLEQLFSQALNNHPDRLVIGVIPSHDVKEMEAIYSDFATDKGNEGGL